MQMLSPGHDLSQTFEKRQRRNRVAEEQDRGYVHIKHQEKSDGFDLQLGEKKPEKVVIIVHRYLKDCPQEELGPPLFGLEACMLTHSTVALNDS